MVWSCLTALAHRTRRFWICGFTKHMQCACGCKGRCTFDSIFSVIVWSFRVWLSGIYPTHRHDGVAFADSAHTGDADRAAKGARKQKMKAKGGVLKKKGDWAWLQQIFGITGWQENGPESRVCFACKATGGGILSYTNALSCAAWRQTMVKDTDFLLSMFTTGAYKSALWGLPGFGLSSIQLDLMHIGDLGIVQQLLGSIIYELFKRCGGLVTKPRIGLSQLTNVFKIASNALRIEIPIAKITIGMIKAQGKDPRLKAKAAETRHMLNIVHWLLIHIFPARDAYEQLRQDCCHQLFCFYAELKTWGPFSPSAASAFARNHVVLYGELCRYLLVEHKTWQKCGFNWYKFFAKASSFRPLGRGMQDRWMPFSVLVLPRRGCHW